jgi:hypothetical protein
LVAMRKVWPALQTVGTKGWERSSLMKVRILHSRPAARDSPSPGAAIAPEVRLDRG